MARSRAGAAQDALRVFTDGVDGEWPQITPTIDASDNIWGVSAIQNGAAYAGAVWSINSHGFAIRHPFTGGSDGWQPNGPLLLGRNGIFYETTSAAAARRDRTAMEPCSASRTAARSRSCMPSRTAVTARIRRAAWRSRPTAESSAVRSRGRFSRLRREPRAAPTPLIGQVDERSLGVR